MSWPERRYLKRGWVGLLFVGCLSVTAADYQKQVWPILENYCLDCHDADAGKPKGDFDLLRFENPKAALTQPEELKRIRNALRFQEMPPPKKKHQPTFEERTRVIDWINRTALRSITFQGRRDPGAPVMRRLTRLEYNNSLRDLLGLESDVFSFPERLMARRDYFQPAEGTLGNELDIFIPEYGSKQPVLLRTENVPGDNRAAHGFFNQGDLLNMSPRLMERYLGLAAKIVDHPDFLDSATSVAPLFGRKALPRPVLAGRVGSGRGRTITVEAQREFAPLDNVKADAPDSSDQAWLFRDHIASAHAEGIGGVFQGAKGNLNAGGTVRVIYGRLKERTLKIRADADLWFVDFATAHETSQPVNIANRQKGNKVMHFDFVIEGAKADEGIVNLGLVVLSRTKNNESSGPVTLTAHFASGSQAVLQDDIAYGAGDDNTFFAWSAPPGDAIVGLTFDGSEFTGDYVLLDDLAFITGRSKVLAGKQGGQGERTASPPTPKKPARTIQEAGVDNKRSEFAKFVMRAFRAGVSERDVSAYWSLYEKELAAGTSPTAAMREAVRAVLSSPRFLFLVEDGTGDTPVRRLDGFELANRLSYFLWSSMPDDELLAAAQAGKLGTRAEIKAQVVRMLKDPKVKELSDSFAYQWMQLNKLIGAQPDRQRYRNFYAGPLGKATMAAPLLQESLLLFETILVENRPIMELIDPDFTWMNHRVMSFYGLDDHYPQQIESVLTTDKKGNRRKDENKWFRCRLPDRKRGGVLAQGSILTLTSLPLRTSPVYRGIWIAEVILNRPPPPPPVVVAELGDDDRDMQAAGLTLRKKLEKHRDKAACAGCHSRIDPLGFALENYDGIGRWRYSYGDLPVDTSGELWGRHGFDDIVGFKNALRRVEGEFIKGFVRHLLTFALGRAVEAQDEQTVDEIHAQVVGRGARLQDIILAIATSYPFTHTRNQRERRERQQPVAVEFKSPGGTNPQAVQPRPQDKTANPIRPAVAPTIPVDTVPVGELSPAEQQAIAQKMGKKAQRFEMWKDQAGNVTGLIFINHQTLTKTAGEKPGIDDDDLRSLRVFPKLSALNFEAQAIGNAGLDQLKRFPQLKQVGFHYMAKHPKASASPDFITVIDGMRDLEILEIKHNFKMDAINVDQLRGPFPRVWRLVLDTPLTAEQTMHLLSLCPNVTDLQLHRTRLTASQLEQVSKMCPKIEVLWWKTRGELKGEHLAALKTFKRLRIFSPQHFRNTLPFENGWDRLKDVPTLERLEVSRNLLGHSLALLDRFLPRLVIDGKLTRSRNYDGL